MRGTTFRRGERDWLNRWHKLETIEGDAMLASVAQRTASTKRRVTSATKQKEPRREFPRVEAASFVLLRALAFESMSTEQFRTFDMSWSDALGKTTDWIDAQPTADELAVATYAARPRFRVRYTR
jgi:1-deoxy-D-xylulose 5-phosphate reductoisomerase